MTTKLTVGYCRKKGLPDFGSVGANCRLEIELDEQLIEHPVQFANEVERAYAAARSAVETELARTKREIPSGSANRSSRSKREATRQQASGFRKATEKQIGAIKAIATRARVSLDPMINRFGAECIEQLSIAGASRLIDELKKHQHAKK